MYWYQNDHLGTPRELTSNSGNIEWEAVYQAWGNTVTVEWQEVAQATELNPIQLNEVEKAYLLQPHRFQGQIYDQETGLHYNRFRYYDPDAGRFISHDREVQMTISKLKLTIFEAFLGAINDGLRAVSFDCDEKNTNLWLL